MPKTMQRMISALVIVLLLVMSLSVTAAPAEQMDQGVLSLAKYFPQDTVAYFAIRTDQAYIDDLDRIWNNTVMGAPLPAEVPMMSLSQALGMGLQQANLTLDDIYAWLGDGFAMGLTSVKPDGSDGQGYLLLQITDRAALESFLNDQFTKTSTPVERTTEGDYTVYSSGSDEGNDTLVLIGDEVAMIVAPGTDRPEFPLATSLLDNEQYQKAAAHLPADKYDVVAYIDPLKFVPPADLDQMQMFGMSATNFAPVMLGGTILDKYSLVIDMLQVGDGTPGDAKRIDPEFLQFIPTDASAVIHATDFTGLFTQVLNFVPRLATEADGNQPDAMTQLDAALQSFGFDLQDDILSWTTGDYALFLRTNMRPVIEGAVQNQVNLAGNFDAGLVIEATDAAKAKTFAAKIGTLISTFLNKQENVKVAQETLEGVDVTSITMTVPLDANNVFTISVVIGASDDVFFISTRDAAETILRGEGGLDRAKAYQQASQYFLPEATSIWYTDGEGFITGVGGFTVGSLALLGPAIGNVFDNIVNDLEAPQSYNPLDVQPVYVQNEDPTQQMLALLDYALRVLGSSSISSTVEPDGTIMLRAVITFNPQ